MSERAAASACALPLIANTCGIDPRYIREVLLHTPGRVQCNLWMDDACLQCTTCVLMYTHDETHTTMTIATPQQMYTPGWNPCRPRHCGIRGYSSSCAFPCAQTRLDASIVLEYCAVAPCAPKSPRCCCTFLRCAHSCYACALHCVRLRSALWGAVFVQGFAHVDLVVALVPLAAVVNMALFVGIVCVT